MHSSTLPQLQPLPSILLSLLAIAATLTVALFLGRRAEHRLEQVRIPTDTPRPGTRPRR